MALQTDNRQAGKRRYMQVTELIKGFQVLGAGAAAIVMLTLAPVTTFGVSNPLPGGATADFPLQLPWGEGVTHTITQAYGSGLHQGLDKDCCNNDHYGLDVDMQLDEPVYPVANGRVAFAGPAAGSWGTFGNIVFVDHLNGYQSVYAHLNSVSVNTGQEITTDTVLGGAGGSGGWKTHLHFVIYKGAKFYNTALGTGQYAGQSVVPEPFANCGKNGGVCENLNRGDRLTKASASAAPAAVAPAPMAPIAPVRSLSSGAQTLSWTPAAGSLRFQVQVVPMNNDGPAIDLVISDPAQVASGNFALPQPVLGQGNYVLLPGAHYTWRVRQSSALQATGADAGWGKWSETKRFSTPLPKSSSVSVVTPPSSYDRTPIIQWNDSDVANFYYEVQVSTDAGFRMGGDAVAPVYWNLVHGGQSTLLNSWAVPAGYELAPGTYFVRVRPRVQATPAGSAEQGVAWAAPVSFEVWG